ncbi:hypothetical protein EST38_g6766 [Candolleomyces aberdarensis]|uniref:DUF4470 domain-containing protein n=1 Tax=Candolleomyces aberdarensis TaxID=2316362 RepID=A0A4V1Q3M3_9AGAR|nr:hypothetical protein EST38_g6766 [Candolleomyces aberdarensis]
MKSSDWHPSWVTENRTPSFISTSEPSQEDEKDIQELLNPGDFNGGSVLWGNMPAIDLINLGANEADAQKDFSLAFVASGDLRHMMKTVNSLPSNFTGKLDILINDANPYVFCRNLALLLILACVPDEKLAADIALHFWYSVFMPAEYRLRVLWRITSFMKHFGDPATRGKPYPLGPTSNLTVPWLDEGHKKCLQHYMFDPETSPEYTGVTIDDAQAEYDRVRMAPSRRDYRDRMYALLKPSHRVAFYQYRQYGIVLPFGAANAHFNNANSSLFSLDGKWLQTDYADPLEGWDAEEVIESGKAHGAQAEDIYGCLYFFLSTQLRTMAQRIRKLPISFKLFSTEACALAKGIGGDTFTDMGITSNTRFDRIEVSNILDFNYVGTRGVLTAWSPFLGQGKHAAIVGYYMNWFMIQKDGRAQGASRSMMNQLTKQIAARSGILDSRSLLDVHNLECLKTEMFIFFADMDALYENSKPFEKFLTKEKLDTILREVKLKLRAQHKIVPHRLNVPLAAPSHALPSFPTKESWYYYTKLYSNTWVERFVEFSREL